MGKIIAIANQKGGVGKTTTAINLSGYLARAGKRVLLIDIDPQGNATSGLGISANKLDRTIYQVLIGNLSASEAVLKSGVSNLSVIPANIHLSGIEIDLLEMEEREERLKIALEQIQDRYDYTFIDCPPNLGILTLNALCAAKGVIITLQTEYYALEGLTNLMGIIQLVQKSLNPKLELEGVVLTMFDQRTSLANEVVKDVREHYAEKVYRTIIPRNVKLSEAPSYGKFIGEYAPDSPGGKAYEELSKEVVENG